MLEEQLKKYWLFRYGGVYSVKKQSRSIIDSLNFTAKLLEEPGNMVQFFPQGMIESQHITAHQFEKGISYVLRHTRQEFHMVFTVALVDYFSDRKPSLHIFFEEYHAQEGGNLQKLESDYNAYYTRCKLWVIGQHHS